MGGGRSRPRSEPSQVGAQVRSGPGQLSPGRLQVLMEWINAKLLPEHIVVRSLEEDIFDGLILHHLFRKWWLPGLLGPSSLTPLPLPNVMYRVTWTGGGGLGSSGAPSQSGNPSCSPGWLRSQGCLLTPARPPYLPPVPIPLAVEMSGLPYTPAFCTKL